MQASDLSGALIPAARYLGRDTSGLVRVEVDGAARHVVVTLEDGWRRADAGHGLSDAILTAFTAATTARLVAWAEQAADHRRPDDAPTSQHAKKPDAPSETFALLSRAWSDLHEYRHRLTQLHAATTTTAAPGRTVVVTVRAGQIAGIELEPGWLRTAGDTEIERLTGRTLSAALGELARIPERVLASCPDLRAVLAMQQPETDR